MPRGTNTTHRQQCGGQVEVRNSKQYQMTEIQMTKTHDLLYLGYKLLSMFGALGNSNFGFVSDFGIRISNLST